MKLITRDTDYALRALCYVARRDGGRVSVSELVSALHVPRPFLRKLLQHLHKRGVLVSYKGQGGGFALRIAADKVLLTDVMRIFQGPFHLNECFLKKAVCPRRKDCILKRKIDAIEDYVIEALGGISVSSLYIRGQKTAPFRVRMNKGRSVFRYRKPRA